MSSHSEFQTICRTIQQNYTACDVNKTLLLWSRRKLALIAPDQVSDALLKLNVPAAGAIIDIDPIPGNDGPKNRIVASVCTVLYVPKAQVNNLAFQENIPSESNLPKDKHWTELPAPGTVVLIQQQKGQICALIGDIIATRLRLRGILGVVADGRLRDIESCATIRKDSGFQMWSRGFSAAAPSLEIQPWMFNVPLQVGDICVYPEDIVCVDEGERSIVVIPKEKLQEVMAKLPILKTASDAVLADIENGSPLLDSTRRHPDFYSNSK